MVALLAIAAISFVVTTVKRCNHPTEKKHGAPDKGDMQNGSSDSK